MRAWQFHASATVTGLDGDGQHVAVAEQFEFDRDAGLASGPNLAVKVGKAANLTAVNGGNHVAGLDAGNLGEAVAIASLPEGMRKRLRVSQQVRAEQLEAVTTAYREAGIAADVRAFFDDMPKRLAECHLVIGRAGASTMAELTCVGRPAIREASRNWEQLDAEFKQRLLLVFKLMRDEHGYEMALLVSPAYWVTFYLGFFKYGAVG
mgnify:CR=1 FL=1